MTDEFIYNWLRSHGAKKGMWADLGKVLGVKPSRAHNYYYNTWSKRFFIDAELYKKQVREVMDEIYTADKPISEIVQLTKEVFCEKYKDCSFHNGYLLQLIYRIAYQIVSKRKHIQSTPNTALTL